MKQSVFQLHPLIPLFYFGWMIGVGMLTNHIFLLAWMIAFAALYLGLFGGGKSLRMALIASVPVALFAILIEPILVHNGSTVFFTLFGFPIYSESISCGLSITGTLLCVVLWFGCLFKAIDGDQLTYLFGKAFPMICLSLCMSFRFLPLFYRRYKEIALVRGKQKEKNTLREKGRNFAERLAILLSWSLESSLSMAGAMKGRGFGLTRRTQYAFYPFQKRDLFFFIWLLFWGGWMIPAIAAGRYHMAFYPVLSFPHIEWMDITTLGMMLVSPLVWMLWEECRWKWYEWRA